MAIAVAGHVLEQLGAYIQEGWPGLCRPIFVIDGTSLQLVHETELVEKFPPGGNQHGANHWPVLKTVVFHDARSGLALQPSWGPMYGPNAVSEQALAKEALGRLPANGVVLADSNFGIFSFSDAVVHSGRPLVARLTRERALRILGKRPVGEGADVRVEWEPSRWDRGVRPGAKLSGRIIVFRAAGRNEWIYVFTTLDLAAEEVIEIYKLRWNVETDLRALKRTVEIHRLSGQNVDVVEKELILGITAYNLVRAVMCLAAQKAGLAPRQLSFSNVYGVIQAILPYLARAGNAADLDSWLERIVTEAARCKLPQRSRARCYPREVWGRGGSYPPHQRSVAEKGASR